VTGSPSGTALEVFCVTEHEHRDRGVADGVLAGRFTVAGQTRALGTEPQWLDAALPSDEEWRIEWVKFAWGLDLAHAAAETGDPAYRQAWQRLVASWIRQVPADHDAPEVTARRILNWIYARQRLAPLQPDLDTALLASVAEQAWHVRENLAPERNHRTLELYALFIVALALPELDPGDLLAFAVAELDRNLDADFRPDGVHREASTHYHLLALRSFVGVRENARRFGVELPEGFARRLSRACRFAMHCCRPDGTSPALSDGDMGDYRTLLALAGEQLDDDALRYVASQGRIGTRPASRCPSFPDAGYFVQRSGWGDGDTPFERERFLVFDCGPLGDGGHGHYDLLSIEACAGGRQLVTDPGRYTYSEEPPNLRRWFKGTAAHNTVCVDGLDQTPYRRGRPDGPVASGRLLGRGSTIGLDVLAGEAVSPAYEAVHQRRIAFVADAYWVIEDRLRGDRPHRYDLRFHLPPEAQGIARVVGGHAGETVLAPGFGLVVCGADAVRLEPGWVAPSYGRRLDAPVVSAAVEDRAEATFVTLLAPLEPGDRPPRVTRIGDEHDATLLRIDGPAGVGAWDTIALRPASCRWRRTWKFGERTVERTVELGGGS
jgi:Heparinase II/III-like protein/Heparinase II/III N-terminus